MTNLEWCIEQGYTDLTEFNWVASKINGEMISVQYKDETIYFCARDGHSSSHNLAEWLHEEHKRGEDKPDEIRLSAIEHVKTDGLTLAIIRRVNYLLRQDAKREDS